MSITIDSLQVNIEGKQLLNDVNLTLPPDKLTLLIGPNGAGKSTLLKACTGDIAPTSGHIRLNQQPLHHYSAEQLSTLRAVMTQDYGIAFSFTVREVVSMGCFVYEQQIDRSQREHIVDDVMRFMLINTLADRQFTTLSGGEQQRTQLARVLAQLWHPFTHATPRYLFLDEPTSSLDIFHQYQVLSLAKQLTQRNIGVLAVVHDLSLAASFADHLVLIEKGNVVTQGKPADVLQPQFLSTVYGISAQFFQHSERFKPSVIIEQTLRA
ncbi:MAG: iron complex transport system ATP-binding protein [Candidatus Endobugula sp.]|jgi:iron complex transport system ATP-binding protein